MGKTEDKCLDWRLCWRQLKNINSPQREWMDESKGNARYCWESSQIREMVCWDEKFNFDLEKSLRPGYYCRVEGGAVGWVWAAPRRLPWMWLEKARAKWRCGAVPELARLSPFRPTFVFLRLSVEAQFWFLSEMWRIRGWERERPGRGQASAFNNASKNPDNNNSLLCLNIFSSREFQSTTVADFTHSCILFKKLHIF